MKILLILLIFSGLVSCSQKFYDGEGNRIPHKVVRLFVKSQFTRMTPKEEKQIKRYFYFNR